jgi:uncharacterized protein YbjT (DUF2867 family)
VGSSYRKTGIAAFDGKWEIEEHIRRIGLPHTILRPTSLMEDWEEMREEIIGGTLAQPLDPGRALQRRRRFLRDSSGLSTDIRAFYRSSNPRLISTQYG